MAGHEANLIDFEVLTLQNDGHHEEAGDKLRKFHEKLLDLRSRIATDVAVQHLSLLSCDTSSLLTHSLSSTCIYE